MDTDPLARAVHALHDLISGLTFPLALPDAAELRQEQRTVLRLLESYAIPRLSQRTHNPLIVVVGGATGAGKSTITNSLIGMDATPSGVIRPTTRQPVMVYNPDDAQALHALGLFRAPSQSGGPDASRWVQLRAVPNEDLPPGLTLIDSPDLDSRVDTNRELATRLLDVADLWLFVTTGTDYADAMSWDLLTQASERNVGLAVVLNRLREREIIPVRNHFASLLTAAGLAHAHVFSLPEVALIDDRVPMQHMRSLQRWLSGRAADHRGRDQLVARAFEGTLNQSLAGSRRLASGVTHQIAAKQRLQIDLESAFGGAREVIQARAGEGALIREDLITVWRTINTRADVDEYGRWNTRASHAAAPAGGGLFRRRGRSGTATTSQNYLAVGRSLNAALTEVLRAQLAQTLWHVNERWEPLREAAIVGAEEISDVPANFNERVASATLAWLTSVQRRVHALSANLTTDLHPTVDPLTLALASLAAEGRPGRTAPLSPETADRAARLREQLEFPLADLVELGYLPVLLRDAWLDLLSVCRSVITQDEARLGALLRHIQLPNDLRMQLLQAINAVEQSMSLLDTAQPTPTTLARVIDLTDGTAHMQHGVLSQG